MANNLLGGSDPRDLAEEEEADDSLVSHELFWDKAVLFLATVITALTAVDFLSEIFRGDTGAVCFVPEELDATESQDRFIQNFCSRNIRKVQYLPIFILIHGFLIGAFHYVWKSSFNNQFSYFFTHAKALCPFKDEVTGEYPYNNVVIIKKLQLKFSAYSRYQVLGWYRVKLAAQLCIAIVSFIISFAIFAENFDSEFDCPSDQESSSWPYGNTTVKCISTSVQLFWLIRLVDVILLVLVIGMLLWGLLWMTIWPHPKELNYKQAALFTFATGLDSGFYVSKSLLYYLGVIIVNVLCWGCRKARDKISERYRDEVGTSFVPRISTDLHLFLLLLYRTDSSLGHAFYEGQVYLQHKALLELDQWLIKSLLNLKAHEIDKKSRKQVEGISTGWEITHSGHRDRFWSQTGKDKIEFSARMETIPVPDNLRGTLMGLALRAPGNQKAVCVSFGNLGLSKTLIQVFVKVGCLNFDPTYRNEDIPVVLEKDSQDLYHYRIIDDIFTKPDNIYKELNDNIEKLWEDEFVDGKKTRTKNDYKIQFMVIGPIAELRHLATAEQLLDKLQTTSPASKYCKFAQDAVLVIIEVDEIEGTNGKNQFFHLNPPKRYFRDFDPKIKDTKKKYKWPIKDEPDTMLPAFLGKSTNLKKDGVRLQCGDTICKFKIQCYLFGEEPHTEESPVSAQQVGITVEETTPAPLYTTVVKSKKGSPVSSQQVGITVEETTPA